VVRGKSVCPDQHRLDAEAMCDHSNAFSEIYGSRSIVHG